MKLISIFSTLFFISINGYAQIADCDKLAGSPFDPQKQTAGVEYDRLNAVLAMPACKNAVAESPRTARLWFQYGRALEKGNKLPDAISAYQEAAKLNSGAAYNNIGELYRDGKGFQKDLKKAEEYFVRAAELNSPEGKDNLLNLRKTTNQTASLAPATKATLRAATPEPAPASAPVASVRAPAPAASAPVASAPAVSAPTQSNLQDFVLSCSKYYSGSNDTVNFSILISEDKTSGYFVYSNKYVYKLKLISKSDSEYAFSTSNYASSTDYFLSYTSVRIDRQSLKLFAKSRGYAGESTDAIDCKQSNFNVMSLVDSIKNQGLAYQRKQEVEAAAKKDALTRNTKF